MRSNTEKRVENTTRSGVFLTNFEVFDLVMKHCVECLILLLKRNDFRWPKTLQVRHTLTLQNIFACSRRITTRFVAPIRKSVGLLSSKKKFSSLFS